LTVPEVAEPVGLATMLANWPSDRFLMMCDETGAGPPVMTALAGQAGGPWGVLIGPEGGFTAEELDGLRKLPFVKPVSLGPRLLRADTAAVAALACWQAALGDWTTATPGGSPGN
jgi:16S rRNA (uracil1498-N3)-methyltransferase